MESNTYLIFGIYSNQFFFFNQKIGFQPNAPPGDQPKLAFSGEFSAFTPGGA